MKLGGTSLVDGRWAWAFKQLMKLGEWESLFSKIIPSGPTDSNASPVVANLLPWPWPLALLSDRWVQTKERRHILLLILWQPFFPIGKDALGCSKQVINSSSGQSGKRKQTGICQDATLGRRCFRNNGGGNSHVWRRAMENTICCCQLRIFQCPPAATPAPVYTPAPYPALP